MQHFTVKDGIWPFQLSLYSFLSDSIGAHCVEKVFKCGCTRSCHRVSINQLYSAIVFDEQTNTNETLEQVSST